MQEPIILSATDELVAKLKAKHKVDAIWHICLPKDGNAAQLDYYFRQPTRAEMSAAIKASKNDEMMFADVIIDNCLLLGNREALENLGVFISVSEHLEALIGKRAGELKKY